MQHPQLAGIFALGIAFIGACASDPEIEVSLEEAQQIAKQRGPSPTIDPAPRGLDDLRVAYRKISSLDESCDEFWRQRQEAIEIHMKKLRERYRGARNFNANELSSKLLELVAGGRHASVSEYLDRAIERLQVQNHRVQHSAMHALAARIHAQSGNMFTARYHRAQGRRKSHWARYDNPYKINQQWAASDLALTLAAGDQFRSEVLLRRFSAGIRGIFEFGYVRTTLAEILAQQGRYAEALAELRSVLRTNGVSRGPEYQAGRAKALATLANILLETGNLDDASWAIERALALFQAACVEPGSLELMRAHSIDLDIHAAQADWPGVIERTERARRELASDDEQFERLFGQTASLALALVEQGDIEEGLKVANAVYNDAVALHGDDSYEAAEALGIRAMGLGRIGRAPEAAQGYSMSLPVLLRGRDEISATAGQPLRSVRTGQIIVSFAEMIEGLIERREDFGNTDPVDQLFRLASIGAGGTVQRALAASIARSTPDDPELHNLLRSEQTIIDRLNGAQASLTNIALAPTFEADISHRSRLRAQVAELRQAHRTLINEIREQYPVFFDFILPRAVQIQEVREALRADEALVLIRTLGARTYVWSMNAGDSSPDFHAVQLSRAELTERVISLRQAISAEDSAGASLGQGDFSQAHNLYEALLKPVDASWKDASTLIVIADGPLATIPFGALLTEAPSTTAENEVPQARFRSMPWLINEVAIVRLPAVTTLLALRSVDAESAWNRPFLGIGDPVFDPETDQPTLELSEERVGVGRLLRLVPETRTLTSASISDLPPLPETSDELKAIADLLGAERSRDLYLQRRATERNIRSLDSQSELVDYKVISFATHGLVPGDLDGLFEPALALSHPGLTDERDDGLLTMTEIVDLKLSADWVILSACNSATSSPFGAEAFSGLGRAFFQAGARSLLLSHWPVASLATKELMIKVFEQYKRGSLSKAEALRQAILEMIGTDSNDRIGRDATYAHPLFWAPFELVGDPT